MKKTIKKVFASVLAFALAVSTFSLMKLNASAEGETVAYLSFADNAWTVQYWNDGNDYSPVVATTAEVTGNGTYTVGLDFTEAGGAADIAFFDVEISNGEAAFPNSYMTIDSVKINGEEVALTGTPYTSSDDGVATRTNLYNAWVSDATTVDNARTADGSADGITPTPVDGTITNINTIEVTFTLGEGVLCNAAGGEVATVLSEESYPAFIAFGGDVEEGDWGFQYYGDGAGSNSGDIVATNGEVKSGETTTLTLEFPSEVYYTWFVAPCFVVEDASKVSPESTFDVKVFLDGEEVTTDLSAGKSCWAEGTGDYDETKCVRIGGGYNEWGDKYLAESPKGFKTITFEITPTIYLMSGEAPEEAAPQNEFDPNGTYHAYIGIQTPTWIFRNSFDDANFGKDSGCFDQLGFVDGEWIAQGGSFTDVEITGNGTYTVSVTGYDFSGQFEDQPILGTDGLFNLLFVSTDLPVNDAVVVSNIVLKMDGKTIAEQESAFLDPDSKEVQKILLANIWNNAIPELPYYAAPTQSIEISFDVSGFANDAAPAPADTTPETSESAPAPTDESTPAPAENSKSNTGLIIGIVIAVVVVIAVAAGVVVAKKKKGDTK